MGNFGRDEQVVDNQCVVLSVAGKNDRQGGLKCLAVNGLRITQDVRIYALGNNVG